MESNAVDGVPVRFQRISGGLCRKPRRRVLSALNKGGRCRVIDLGLQGRFLRLKVQDLRTER